ncbi:hypothetical protein [Xanthomonas theicola]|uniref:hypothetical protein n=1 Tax=Xanthomonas theicola TaxID=56464 RepID=UPI0013049934|nr:hypothetical protein [Xanthomonas theicola]QNH25518.1 hypothetical protein G4Q83_13225 [Xanthomonas theicola]
MCRLDLRAFLAAVHAAAISPQVFPTSIADAAPHAGAGMAVFVCSLFIPFEAFSHVQA